MNNLKFDSVILDIDGTIWNTTEVVATAWNKAIDKNFPQVKHVTADILKGQFGKTMKVIADNLFSVLTNEEKDVLMDKCCEEEQLALSENTNDISYEGVVEGIEKLSKIVPVFIVSNCQDGYVEVVIEKNKLGPFVKDFECYGRTGLGKGENLKLICNRNNLKSPVYIGDTKGDQEACEEAGIPFVWAEYGFGKSDSFYAKISCFSEIFAIING